MGIIESRNKEEARHEENGVVYYDRGVLTGRDGRKYLRYAIQTHFIEVGEDKCALIERYVRPLYREGDMLSFGAKVMAMCEKTVRTRDEVKPGFWANLLWRFAGINHTGVGMHEPLQAAIGHRYAAACPVCCWRCFAARLPSPLASTACSTRCAARAWAGIDGFYFRSSFDRYKELALINPDNPVELCDEIMQKTGIPTVLMDANDIDQNQLGKCHGFPLTDEQIQDAMADNPSGQGDELTPFILIRPVE